MALTLKQQRFVDEYVIDLNATQAAIRAGYSEDSAGAIGSENLTKPEIAEAVKKRIVELQQSTGLTAERLLNEVRRMAFFDPRKLFDENGNLKPITELDDDTAAALAAFEVTEERADIEEKSKVTGYTKKLKWYDKNAAIDKGMRYFGMLTDRVEHTGKDGKDLIPIDSSEIARKVAFLLASEAAKKGNNNAV